MLLALGASDLCSKALRWRAKFASIAVNHSSPIISSEIWRAIETKRFQSDPHYYFKIKELTVKKWTN
jgi:hypothetical protein